MDKAKLISDLDLIRMTIAICKHEVEESIGADIIDQMDTGSPWGRAFIKACREVRLAKVEVDTQS